MSFGGNREIFQNVSSIRGSWTKSFEEHRFDDYLKAYQTTSKRPPPCPPNPLDAHQRNLHGLPPLFQPHVEMMFGAASYPSTVEMTDVNSSATSSDVVIDPSLLPATQVFRATREGTDKFQSIVLQTEFTNFSVEELRYHAYARGNKLPPTPIPTPSTTSLLAPLSFAGTPINQFTPVKSPLASDPRTAESTDQYQSITTQPAFIMHSVEELRVAYFRHGRELNSREIYQSLGQVAPTPAPVALTAAPSLFAPTTSTAPLLFSPSTSTAPSLLITPSQSQSFTPSAASTPRPSVFGGSGNTSIFGTPAPVAVPATPSLFGGAPPPIVASASASSSFSFGSSTPAAPANGLFGVPPAPASTPTPSLFGTPANTQNGTGSLFGGSNAFRGF